MSKTARAAGLQPDMPIWSPDGRSCTDLPERIHVPIYHALTRLGRIAQGGISWHLIRTKPPSNLLTIELVVERKIRKFQSLLVVPICPIKV